MHSGEAGKESLFEIRATDSHNTKKEGAFPASTSKKERKAVRSMAVPFPECETRGQPFDHGKLLSTHVQSAPLPHSGQAPPPRSPPAAERIPDAAGVKPASKCTNHLISPDRQTALHVIHSVVKAQTPGSLTGASFAPYQAAGSPR